jgi:hypothetical protein
MIKHIVFWTFKDQAEGATRTENAARAKALLEACADLVPGILRSTSSRPSPAASAPRTWPCIPSSPTRPRSTPTNSIRSMWR